jgi:hypothetical protein
MNEYIEVAAGVTDQKLGSGDAARNGDLLERLVCVVATALTSNVSIKDGAGGASISILPAAVGAGVGTYPINLSILSAAGHWHITTGAGVTVIATGRFKNAVN